MTQASLAPREPPAFRAGSAPVQRAPLRVSSPEDAGEREATAAAGSVLRMDTPALARAAPGVIQRAAPAARTGAPGPTGAGGGEPLPASMRRFMEPRFRADFGAVRIHTDAQAAAAARRLGARAFTSGNHIWFGAGQYQPQTPAGLELIAHELAHTVQQGAAPRTGVQRSADLTLTPQPPGRVQRLGLGDILDGLAELAANVPGFTLLTLIIGRNPINMRAVERTPVNLLRAFMGLVPGGEILFQVLQRYGVIQRLGDWVAGRAAQLGLNFQAVRDAFTRFTDSLGFSDIFSPGDVWRRARAVFTPLIDKVTAVVGGLVAQAITWLKEAFLAPLSNFCRQVPGYGLVTVLLGRDPFSGAPVPRTALTLVRAFAEFIPGGTEKVNQLVETGALQRAYQWFLQETQARNLTWTRIAGTFTGAWNSLRLEDVLHPIDTIQRMVGLFRPLLGDLVGFAGAALMKLLELVYEAAMGAGGRRILQVLMKARATFITIIRDPVGFLRNLLGAVGQGVRQFMGNILAHLRDGVIAWLTGPVARAGIQMPERWDLRGIIWFVLQILGLTWARVRQKLVNLLGERVMGALESGFQLVQEIREKGLVQALRDRVSEFFGNLRDAALGAIRGFIQRRLVIAGITQLVSMLNPVGAIIQAIIKTYTTIQFFIQRIHQILELVESVVNSVAAIAAGAIGAAASLVQRTMARTIPVILDFLARFIGLGDVAGQVTTTVRNLQASVDRMLDRAVEWIRNQARNLASRLLGGDPSLSPQARLQNGVREGTAAVNRLSGSRIGLAVIQPVLAVIRLRHKMQKLDAEGRGGKWWVVGMVNPTLAEETQKLEERGAGAEVRTYEPVTAARFGSRATVKGLSKIGAQNQPSVDNPHWNLITRRLFRAGAASFYYVRGHLINGTFGGPGNDWRNLTPLTQTANNRSIASMLSTFEKPVRDAVNAYQTADLEVTAKYGARGMTALAQRVRDDPAALPGARSSKERKAIADLLEAEEHVPIAIEASAVIRKGTQVVKTIRERTENVIDIDLSRYWHGDYPPAGGARARREVNLSTATTATLQTLAAVDAALALRIVNARPASGFRDRDHFISRLGADGAAIWHQLSSTAGIKLVF